MPCFNQYIPLFLHLCIYDIFTPKLTVYIIESDKICKEMIYDHQSEGTADVLAKFTLTVYQLFI